ncbi:DUF3237 domain-containing protein [Candidatus Viadribacter manganicus]|uniref:UPF0311 protein ATE48_06890 n=1 Tax=Candidatus Viadribacter manganicus TaxID=1759059 RepID=A0A1B1AGH0_9PROT|nr:DUF3237 domain-containing protein [Candidatus Viadribacter manganicus]ANP45666.1 hypothetical protein ATE48_06890 [Candidatus Viadribacter manganicus]
MIELAHTHLMTLTLDVDFAGMVNVGTIPAGVRRIAPVSAGAFNGERLRGRVQGGADWVIHRPDSVMTIDVRLTLTTEDQAAIYLAYKGRFLAAPEAMARFARGAQLRPDEYSLVISAAFECGDPRYAWLNNCLAVGVGAQIKTGVVYQIFDIG